MAEIIVLDPTAESPGRTQLDITAYIDADGPDWGDAAIVAAMADSTLGSLPVDYRVPNRTVTIPLILKTIGATTFDTIRQQIQAKAALFQREGGWLSRQTSIGTVYATVVSATLKLGGDWFQANRNFDTTAVLTLECLPDWYGAEITLDDIVETTNHEIATTLKLSAATAAIKGDYPGRLRLVVDDDQAQIQQSLLWGFRSRNYSSAATARPAYEAEALTALDAAAITTITGALPATNNVIRHNALSTSWTPVLSTQATGGGAHMTHVGSYRVWARVYTTSTTPPKVRLIYDVGDLVNPEENDSWTIPGSSNFYIANLGEVRLDQALQGTHRWQGVIQAQGTVGGENVSVDKLWFQPVDEFAGILRGSASLASSAVATHIARDEFNQSTGALAAKTAAFGGTWASVNGTGGDFTVDGALHVLQRATVSDTTSLASNGRVATVGTASFTTSAVQVDFKSTSLTTTHYQGVVARYVDASNWLMAAVTFIAPDPQLLVYTVQAGSVLSAGGPAQIFLPGRFTANSWSRITLAVDTGGRWSVWLSTPGSALGSPVAVGQAAALATGGVLATGKTGIYDWHQSATAVTRNYDNFVSWVPAGDAVVFASQSAELRWDGMVREDSAGVAYGPVSQVTGDLARIPPSGLEGRPVEIFLKASRGDLENLPDTGIDDISARAFYKPSWLSVPGS